MEQNLLGKHLFGELPSSVIEIVECFAKIIDHFGDVQTHPDEEDAWRNLGEQLCCLEKLKTNLRKLSECDPVVWLGMMENAVANWNHC